VLERGVVGHIGVDGLLDMPEQPVDDLGRLDIGVAVDGMDVDAGLVLPGVVHDLADEARQPVDGEAGPAFELAALADLGPATAWPGARTRSRPARRGSCRPQASDAASKASWASVISSSSLVVSAPAILQHPLIHQRITP
jgi:hypothetical protein